MCKRGQILPEAGSKAAGREEDRLITGASGPDREAFGCSCIGTFSFPSGLAGSHKFPSPTPPKAGILV